MKDIKILELTASNFKAQNFHDVYKDINYLSGKNGSGKSTRISAWLWLLSSYCSATDAPNSCLFDNKVEVTPQTPVASVEAVVLVNGEEYRIRREAEASFQRRRGTSEFVKSASDSYKYFIDNIERSSGDFKDWISENIAPEDMLKFCLSGEFFVNLCFEDKRKARTIIEKLVGTVTREEMSGDYECIDELLRKFSLDEIDARCANLIKAINDRLNEIPALIRNKESEIAEIEQTDFVATDREITELEAERDNLDKQMTDLTERINPQMEAKHEGERTFQMKKDALEKAYEDWKKSFDVRRQKLADEINAIRQQNAKSENARKEAEQMQELAKSDLKSLETQLATLNEKRNRLVAERDAEKEKKLDPSATICPHCGAELKGEKLQSVIDNFEKVKRERINAIVTEGKDTGDKIKRIKESIERTKKLVEEPLPQVITQPTEDLEKQVFEIINTNTSKIAFLETEHGRALLDDICSVVIPEVVMPDNTDIAKEKKEVNDKLVPLYERRGLKNRLTALRKALDELHIEQKEKGAEMAQYELQRQAVKDYKQEQMEILSRKVNDGLKFSRLEVWSKQKDGQVVADLVLKDENGVNFATSNGANRIRVTADIQRFFCDRLGVNMPLWIDESSVLQKENIPHYDGVQTFLLFCSETSLKIESK